MTTWPLLHPAPHWSAICYISGRPYEIVAEGWSKAFGLDRDRSSCTVLLRDEITLAGGETAYVDVICNGIPRRFFTGFARRDTSQVDTGSGVAYRYQIVDVLGALDSSPSSAISWSSRAFDDAVTDLLTAAGLDSSQIGPIYDPGSAYDLGTFDSITIDTTETLSTVMRNLMTFAGAALWASPNGTTRVTDNTGIPTANSDIAYAWLPSGTDRPIYSASQQFGQVSAIVTTWTARGPTRSDGAEPNYTHTASGISGRADGDTYRYMQTGSGGAGQAIAEREVNRRARQIQEVSFDAMFDPDLMPGRTIFLDTTGHPSITIKDMAFVESISVQADVMTVACVLGPSRVPGSGYSEYPPPYADFAFTLEAELVDVGGSLEKRLIVQCDASASYVAQGTISYSWSVSGATSDPASIPAVVDPIFVLDTGDPAGVSITLTVSDGVGTPQPVTKALDDPAVESVTRVLSIARGSNGWRVLRDINTGYEDFTRAGQSCDATAKFSANGPLLSGWDDGAVYSWEPEGGSATLLWTEPSGTGITSIYRNQETAEDIIVTAGTKLYRSQDNGATFTLLYTAAATINDVETAPGGSYIRICTGNTVLNSYDSTTFPAAQTGEAGSTCQQQANAGFADGSNAACYTGTTTSAGLVVFDQGHSVDWSGVTAPSGITTISAALTEEAFVCGDASGNLYKLTWDGSQYVASDIGQTDATGTAADLIRDDRLNELVFGSDSTWQSFKVLNFATILPIDLQPSVQIGIGPLANLSPQLRLLIPTVGLTGGGVYEYSGGSWTLRNNGLPATTLYSQGVVAEPNNPDIWYAVFTTNADGDVQVASGELVGNDGSTPVFWRWDGSTWSSVALSIASIAAGSEIEGNFQPLSIRTSGWSVAVRQAVTGSTSTSYVFEGVGTSQTRQTTTTDYGITCVDVSASGDVVGGTTGSSASTGLDPALYIRSGTITEPSGTTGDQDYFAVGTYPTGNRALWCSSDAPAGGLWYAADYTAAQPTQILGAGTAGSVVITTEERAYVGGGPSLTTRAGIAEVLDVAGAPSLSVVAASGADVGRIGMDKQTRTLVAALNDLKDTVYLWDGTTETTIDASSLTAANLRDYVEPIQ